MVDCRVNKELKVGTHISFNHGTSLVDGYIREKTNLDRGDISFLIETEDGKFCSKTQKSGFVLHIQIVIYNLCLKLKDLMSL